MSFYERLSPRTEIARLRRAEEAMDRDSSEADRLVCALLSVYACDFVIAGVPLGYWVALPGGWQCGISDPLPIVAGFPPCDYRGAVAVNIVDLRKIAADAGVMV